MSAITATSILRQGVSGCTLDPIVHLDNGLSVQGRLAPAALTVAEFLGIPYAQPPVNELRWAPPQEYEVAPNTSMVNATALPPSCWQYISVKGSRSCRVRRSFALRPVLGFPTAAGLPEQNFGLMDQRFAVQWIHERIAKLCSDPERMVIWGQSAGIYRERTDFSSFSLVASHFGCGNQTNPETEVECMRKVPASELENFVATYEDSGASPSINFIPVVDKKLVFNNYTQKAADGEMSELTALEHSYNYFWCPATLTTYERLDNKRVTHRYYYTRNFSNMSPRPWMEAYHESELPMLLFGTHMNFRGNSTPFEYAVSHALQDAYLAFVTDPVGGLDLIGWPAYGGRGGSVMRWADMSNLTVPRYIAHLTTVDEIEQGCESKGLLTSLAQGS
ncbi:carboxylesterase [Diaporthe helianthi]|uniref:Carboxylesterase n=1 Tax=Diaporthe helianthi TaxID=158607 RepID=A0A2P5HGG3_DIAHE|nr:carboxylesterase [Diaporthe helianthi]